MNRLPVRSLVLSLAIAPVFAASVFAQQQPPQGGGEQRQEQRQKAPGELPSMEELTKDMLRIPADLSAFDGKQPMITFFRNNPNDPTKDATKTLALLPRSVIGADLLLAASISRGAAMGNPAATDLVRFELQGNKVILSVPNVQQKETPGKPVTGAVQSTYTPRFLAVLPVMSRTPQGDVIVDMGPLFSNPVIAGIELPPNVGVRGDLTKYNKVKSFPDNVLVDVDISLAGRSGDGETLGVSYAFRRLPDLRTSDFRPRPVDERVGYFSTTRQDWNAPYTDRENLVRYINRWNLRKLDPGLELSPPAEPIVFVIESTVPLQWRRYVREGIEEWNKAYEKTGIVGAIVVQQQTDTNEYKDIDPEDARYNFIRWIVTGKAYAMGPSRPDPRTGEILDADIIFDDSMLRSFVRSVDIFGPSAIAGQMGPGWIEFLEKNPSFLPMGMTLDSVKQQATEMRRSAAAVSGNREELLLDDHAQAEVNQRTVRSRLENPTACSYADGMRHQMDFAQLAMLGTSTGKKIPENIVGQMIRSVVSHEVGHTLGLRHNFKGSTWLSLEDLKKARDAGNQPTIGSVMDYDAYLYFPGDNLETVKTIVSPVIGPYDFWAIDYGYTQIQQGGGESRSAFEQRQKKELEKIASRSNEPGLAYGTDEDTTGAQSPDPTANRWDHASDPIAWAYMRNELADNLLAKIKDWAITDNDPNYVLRSVFGTLLSEKARNMQYVARLVGGQEVFRNRKGDPGYRTPLSPVSPERQREALKMLSATVFSEDFFKIDPTLWNDLAPARYADDGFPGNPGGRLDYPAHETLLRLQNITLMQLMTPVVLQRVYDTQLKTTGDDVFTAAELLSWMQGICWGDLSKGVPAGDQKAAKFTDAKPMLSSIRRNLQVQHVAYLLASSDSQLGSLMSPDLQSLVRYNLRQISAAIGEALKNKGNLDIATLAHLTETKERIDKNLESVRITVDSNVGRPFGRE